MSARMHWQTRGLRGCIAKRLDPGYIVGCALRYCIAKRFKFDCIVGLLYRTVVLLAANLCVLKIKVLSYSMVLLSVAYPKLNCLAVMVSGTFFYNSESKKGG